MQAPRHKLFKIHPGCCHKQHPFFYLADGIKGSPVRNPGCTAPDIDMPFALLNVTALAEKAADTTLPNPVGVLMTP